MQNITQLGAWTLVVYGAIVAVVVFAPLNPIAFWSSHSAIVPSVAATAVSVAKAIATTAIFVAVAKAIVCCHEEAAPPCNCILFYSCDQ